MIKSLYSACPSTVKRKGSSCQQRMGTRSAKRWTRARMKKMLIMQIIRKPVFLLFFLVLLHGMNPAEVRGRVIFESDEIVIVGDSSLERMADHLLAIYPAVKADLEDALRWRLETRPIVVLVEDRRIFEKMSGSPHLSAIAVPRSGVVAINLQSVSSHVYHLNDAFKHELCHLLLHEHISRENLPRWLDEGTCQWVSGSLGEILAGAGSGMPGAVGAAGKEIPLHRLEHSFPADRHLLLVAYETSRGFLDYISSQYGRDAFLDILGNLKEGRDVREAFLAALSKTPEEVEAQWRDSLRGRGIWFVRFGQYLYEILFFGAALLTVPAFFRIWLKRRYSKYGDEDGEDDEKEDSSDSTLHKDR